MTRGAEQPTQATDEELVAAVLRGDRERFGDLIERYQGRLVNYLFRLLRNADDAHDLAQEVLVKVYQVLDRYDPQYKFSTWLFRVAQNAAIDQIRRRRLKLVSLRQEDDEGENRDWDLPSPERGPYGELRNQERGVAIQDAIDALPWEYRELILLRHFGELPYEEIARLKQMPLGTVKNKLFRGRQMLKEKLQEFLSD
ncbi:MAG TPA: sigma-70 family RNA polymerase sigma factor [Thermoanaerobaculia bacterium]|jgi:RNA polymerase sigma-70 factor (ECF subfamily)|nr:sigma-70 family RNA polymerase sigma factor [Thermoanaerobaculia bacterium]